MAEQPHARHAWELRQASMYSVPELLATLWRRRWILVASVLVCLALAVVYIVQAEPVYEVHAKLLVQRQTLPLEEQRDVRRDEEFLATQAEILSSPAVVSDALEAHKDLLPVTSVDKDPLRIVLANLSASPVTGTNVIKVQYVGREEHPALRTVAAVVDSYQRFSRSLEHDAHRETLALLTENERQLRGELEAVEEGYEQLREQGPVVGQGSATMDLQQNIVANLGQTLMETRTRRLALQNQLAAFSKEQLADAVPQAGNGGGILLASTAARQLPDTIPSPAGRLPESILAGSAKLRAIEEKLFQAREREKELALVQGPKNPELRGVREQIAEWERLRAEQLATAPSNLESELTAVQLHEQDLQRMYEEELAKARTIDLYLVKEQQALGEIQRIQGIHDSILTQLRALRLADSALHDGRSRLTVSVLQNPTLVASGISPPALVALGICGIVGLIGGCGMIMLLENRSLFTAPAIAGNTQPRDLSPTAQWEDSDYADSTAATERLRRSQALPAR